MLAYHNDSAIKEKYLSRVRAHAAADEIIKGVYWEDGKGCAIGCLAETADEPHKRLEEGAGIPEWLSRVADVIFEGLDNGKSKAWVVRFPAAIKTGSNLDKVKTPFLIFVLESCLESMAKAKFDAEKFPDVKKALDGSRAAVTEMIRCHREGLDLSAAESAAESAESAARSAAESAWSAARSAAESAWSAAGSARSAAESAWSAAESARSAAWSAAWSAAESAAWSAWSAAWSAAFEKFADKLIELIEELEPEARVEP